MSPKNVQMMSHAMAISMMSHAMAISDDESCDGNSSQGEEIIEIIENLSPSDTLEHLLNLFCYMQNKKLLANEINIYIDKKECAILNNVVKKLNQSLLTSF